MIGFLQAVVAVLLPLFFQTLYLAYRFGRVEEQLANHEYRLVRLERAYDDLAKHPEK